jgi:hypothetical protein
MGAKAGSKMLKQKIPALLKSSLIVVLVSLLFLELTLRLSGAFLLWRQASRNGASDSESKIRIVAIGESTTADFPSGSVKSWPRVLEGILRQRGYAAQVFNEGMIGASTPVLLSRIEKILAEERPQIVIAMMGVNDHEGRVGYRRVGLVNKQASGFFSSLRVVKLFHLLEHWNELGLFTPSPPPSINAFSSWKPPAHFSAALELAKTKSLKQGKALLDQDLAGSSPENRALAYHTFANSLAPPLGEGFDRQAFLPAYELHKQSLRVFFFEEEAEFLALLAMLYQDKEECRFIARSYVERAFQPSLLTAGRLSNCGPGDFPEAQMLREKYAPGLMVYEKPISGEERENYLELEKTLEARGICLIAMQYPLWRVEKLVNFFPPELVAKGEKTGRLTFLENQQNFQLALRTKPYNAIFLDRFAGDFGHATQVGNDLIAENAAGGVERLIRTGKCVAEN